MNEIKIAIIGIGNIGNLHAENILSKDITGVKLVAFCDVDEEKLKIAKKNMVKITSFIYQLKRYLKIQKSMQ